MSDRLISKPITFPINEIFTSIQGEGFFTGTPAIFIRMQGCSIECAWCDTKHTWKKDVTQLININSIIAKTANSHNWGVANIDDIVMIIKKFQQIQHIIITGGEPLENDLSTLCERLITLNKTIQIETSGTFHQMLPKKVWLTVSPKININKNLPVLDSMILRANEIKMPVGKIQDIISLKELLLKLPKNHKKHIYLQPLSQNLTATKLCLQEAIQNNWNLSIQMHQYLKIR